MALALNLSWIDDVLALAASGNFSRAADDRHMTQPAFSRRIRALEDWLGEDLFDRRSQPARLTPVGTWFVGIGHDLQSRVAGLPGEARAIAEAASTTLRFAATHALSFTFLPRWWQGLEAEAALGPIELVSDVQERCESLLAQHRVHFVLAHAHPGVPGPLDEAVGSSLVVGADALLPVSAPEAGGRARHALLEGGPATSVAWLGSSPGSGLGRILQTLKGPQLERLPLQRVLTAHLASVIRTMALDGRGLAWLPASLVGDDLASGRLVVAAPDAWRIDLEIRLYRDPAGLGDAAEAFWNAARARAGPRRA